MQAYHDTVQDQNGNIMPTAQITVTDTSNNAVTVYSNNSLIFPITQPFTPNQYGQFTFYAPDGRYTIHVTYNSVSYTLQDVFLEDIDGGASKSTPVDADTISIYDSVAIAWKKLTWANLKTNILALLSVSSGAASIGFIQSGTGAVARTVQDKERDIVSVFDFMTPAQISDVQARTLTQDVTTAIQTAITYAQTYSLTLRVPSGAYKLTNQINITATLQIVGDGIYRDAITTLPQAGSVFVCTFNTGVAAYVFYATGNSVSMSNIEIYCNYQPAEVGGWTPITTPISIGTYCAPFADTGANAKFNNIMIRGMSLGIHIAATRCEINGLFGQTFGPLLFVDGCYDTIRVSNYHQWIFYAATTNISAWCLANATGIYLGRCDNPNFNNIFIWNVYKAIVLSDSGVGVNPSGSVYHSQWNNIGIDNCWYGLYLNGTSGYPQELDISNIYCYNSSAAGTTGTTGSRGVWVSGTSPANIKLANADFTGSQLEVIKVDNGVSTFEISNLKIRSYNTTNNSKKAIDLTAGTWMQISSSWGDTTQGNGQPLIGGAGTINGPIYSPAVTVGSAAITITASPFTYTAGSTYEYVVFWGGAITAFTISGFGSAVTQTMLRPGQSCIVTYTVLPTGLKNVL